MTLEVDVAQQPPFLSSTKFLTLPRQVLGWPDPRPAHTGQRILFLKETDQGNSCRSSAVGVRLRRRGNKQTAPGNKQKPATASDGVTNPRRRRPPRTQKTLENSRGLSEPADQHPLPSFKRHCNTPLPTSIHSILS